MIKCLLWHDFGPWSLVRAWEYSLEEFRFCSKCGKMERGSSWRVADREAVIKIHADTMPVSAKIQHIWDATEARQ